MPCLQPSHQIVDIVGPTRTCLEVCPGIALLKPPAHFVELLVELLASRDGCDSLLYSFGSPLGYPFVTGDVSQPQVRNCLPRSGVAREILGELRGCGYQIALASARPQSRVHRKDGAFACVGGETFHDALRSAARILTPIRILGHEYDIRVRQEIELAAPQPSQGHNCKPGRRIGNGEHVFQCSVSGATALLQSDVDVLWTV